MKACENLHLRRVKLEFLLTISTVEEEFLQMRRGVVAIKITNTNIRRPCVTTPLGLYRVLVFEDDFIRVVVR